MLERRERHGTETSSRNSEVIHAGMYYPAGSLKARLCVRGQRAALRALRAARASPTGGSTKLIVATAPAEVAELERLLALGRANGVELAHADRGASAAASSRPCPRWRACSRRRRAS